MDDLEERKEAVLKKFYGGERTALMHDFRLGDGVCENCGTFLGDAVNQPAPRMCNSITKDEIGLFRQIHEYLND